MIQVQRLLEECTVALDSYARQARRTCELLDHTEGTTPTLDQLLSVSAQTQAEDDALQAYLLLRQRLFDAWSGTRCEREC